MAAMKSTPVLRPRLLGHLRDMLAEPPRSRSFA